MTQTARQMIMLRPMQPGLSGYARVQAEGNCQMIQIHIRGAKQGVLSAFWYAGEGVVRPLGQTPVNPRGEASLSTQLPADAAYPGRVSALLIAGGTEEPAPMMIGLCASQSSGSLLDAKNALLALCDKLGRAHRQKAAAEQQTVAEPDGSLGEDAPKVAQPRPAQPPKTRQLRRSASRRRAGREGEDAPPREVFLPAIDPASCLARQAKDTPPAESAPEETTPACLPHTSSGEPVAELLPELSWPAAFSSLAPYFLKYPPCRLMDWPGWRFVRIDEGKRRLWLGYLKQDDRVSHVAYALPGDALLPDAAAFRPCTGADGQALQVLVQRAEG